VCLETVECGFTHCGADPSEAVKYTASDSAETRAEANHDNVAIGQQPESIAA